MSSSNSASDEFSGKKFALCIHDLRASRQEETIGITKTVMEIFSCPVTLHIVFDAVPGADTPLFLFLKNALKDKKIEVVFHGLSHAYAGKYRQWLSFYHKHQAEYLDDNEDLRARTGDVFEKLKRELGTEMGICPPCWIAHKNNLRFFAGLKPLFIESILGIAAGGRKYFSPVISLGSPVRKELIFLRLLGRLMYGISLVRRKSGVRVAIHLCDIAIPSSMEFFKRTACSFHKKGFIPALLRDLF